MIVLLYSMEAELGNGVHFALIVDYNAHYEKNNYTLFPGRVVGKVDCVTWQYSGNNIPGVHYYCVKFFN